jgi:acetoin utilization protein AcuB
MLLKDTPIRELMTSSPYSIGRDQPLAAAHALMRANHIRHLPVLHGGKLVGIVSSRDLHLVETLPDTDPETLRVEEAMSPEVFTVGPDASLGEVAATMAERKLGSAVVVQDTKVVGIFTAVDALRSLAYELA